ncbi:MAG: hypothetical protein JJU34_12465 [Lunatimonas sp.]|uniref:hypothetical protein n=1 Tax=Lunatimonas sp. TaxID=2060141 RepID=UPI00263B23C7|nr:hypothetical protein [Lunatimonas sp.]MCC5938086.1 hypothetical protein [Lunatimonas sp.]
MKLLLTLLLSVTSLWTTVTPPSADIFLRTEKEPVTNFEDFAVNKEIPDEIRDITLEALSFFPDLMDVKIDFQFKPNINGSVMQAQPKVFSVIFNNKDTRAYRVKVSRHLVFEDGFLPIEELPRDVLLGWIGHELGHIMDYLDRSSTNLLHFGAKYFCSPKFVTQAEINADTYAVAAGLGNQIITHKQYVLNHDMLSEEYKEKIRRLYLSPSQIMTMIDEDDYEQVN